MNRRGKAKLRRSEAWTEEVRHGRNYIRLGDLVHVRALVDGAHGFLARFAYADVDRGGLYYCVRELVDGKYAAVRFVKPERVTRRARTKDPVYLDAQAAEKESLDSRSLMRETGSTEQTGANT